MKIWRLIPFFVMPFIGIGYGVHYEKEQKMKREKESYTHQMAVCHKKSSRRKNFFGQKSQNITTL